MNRRKVAPILQSITLRLRFVLDSRSNSPLPIPRPSLAPLGDGREPHSDACAALACKHDRPYLLVCVRFALAHQLSFRRMPESIPDPDSAPPPVGLGRGAQSKMDQGERLSERSEFELDPVFDEHRRLPGAKRKDPDHRVAFLLGTFLWRRKEKCLARRGETRLARRPNVAHACKGLDGLSQNQNRRP